MIDVSLYVVYFLIFAAIFLALGFAGWYMIKNFKKNRNMLFGAAGLVVLFFLSYALSSNEVYEKFQVGETLSKIIGGTIIMLYIMFIFTFIAAIYAEISKLFK